MLRYADTLAESAVTAPNIAVGAITLGYEQITSPFSTTSSTPVAVTGLSVNVTIPDGGRKIRITVEGESFYNLNNNLYALCSIWDGAAGSGTKLAQTACQVAVAAQAIPLARSIVVTPAAGSKTYSIGLAQLSGGTAQMSASTTSPAYILVEAI